MSAASMNALADAIEAVAGRLSIATRPEDAEQAVEDLLTIAGNARSGLLDETSRKERCPAIYAGGVRCELPAGHDGLHGDAKSRKERCPAIYAGGVRCELPAGHDGLHGDAKSRNEES